MDTSSNIGVPHNFTPVNTDNLSKKKGKTPLFIIAILLVLTLGVGVSLFLVSRPQIFEPRAAWRGDTLYKTNCSPFKEWKNSKDGAEYDCDAPAGEKNEFDAQREVGILRGFLNFPKNSNNVCFIRHYRCQKRQGETNTQFIARMQGEGCQDTQGYTIYVNKKNPAAPYNQNFRNIIESDRLDKGLLAKAKFTQNWCGAQQMDIQCGDIDMVFNTVIDLRDQTCKAPTPTPTPTLSPTPTPTITPTPPSCPVPDAVTNLKINCPLCNQSQ